MSEATHKEWVWKKYSDASKDSIIVSCDKESTLFFVDSYRMLSLSETFKEAKFDEPLPKLWNVSYKSESIAYFLDQIYDEEPEPPKTWEIAKSALDFCKEYKCPIIAEIIRSNLGSATHIAPWDIFGLASVHNNLFLAKKAIEVMGEDKRSKEISLDRLKLREASQVTKPYLIALLRRIERDRRGSYASNWRVIAMEFKPLE